MVSLMERMLKSGSIKATTLDESKFFGEKEFVTTNLPILNIAFSGDVLGGFASGITITSGMSRTFKTLISLYCIKAYLDKYPDAMCLFYDSEFGTPPDYLKFFKIDISRIVHIPVEHVEQLKFDLVKRLEEIKRGDKVFIFLDSLGALASKKEVDDANDEKSVADLSRAKSIRSLLRIVTPHLTTKDLPFMIVNHVYQSLDMYSRTVIPGGTAVTFAPNTIFVITKSQEKDLKTNEITGYNFTINIEKSRFVREKSKFTFSVGYNSGISKYSGLFEIAQEAGIIIPGPKKGNYLLVNPETGEIGEKPFKQKVAITKEFWNPIINSIKFQDYIKNRYKVASKPMIDEDETYVIPDEEEIED